MVERLAPIWDGRARLTAKPGQVEDIVREGSRRAAEVARRTLAEVTDAMKI